MGTVQVTPFERAVCAWVLELSSAWVVVARRDLSHTHEKALERLVKGGFVEARLPVVLNVRDLSRPMKTLWRVTGAYGAVLGARVREYLSVHGHGGKEVGIICGDYESVRLTADGELAKQDFEGTVEDECSICSDGTVESTRRPGVYYDLFSMVAGGHDGTGGVKPPGVVTLESNFQSLDANGADREEPRQQPSTQTEHRFAVAFSFPGERRRFVQAVDKALGCILPPDAIFYDERYKAELARPCLDHYLQSIYHDDSELIVVFLCKEYREKEWCGLELRAICDLLKKGRMRDIMFFRFDDATVPGVFSTDGYVDANRESPETAAKLIHDRLRHNRGSIDGSARCE